VVLFYPYTMKYRRLTKEQLEELHQEFINFLATQSITGAEWQELKEKQPEVAEQELDVFSDLIWEGVLQKAQYLANTSAKQLYFFKAEETGIRLILVKIEADEDLTSPEGLQWLQENLDTSEVELFTAEKEYVGERNQELFALIEQGAVITDAQWFDALEGFIRT